VETTAILLAVKTFDVSLFFTLSKEKTSPFKDTMIQSIFENSDPTMYLQRKKIKNIFEVETALGASHTFYSRAVN
jgi:hypothetical protein